MALLRSRRLPQPIAAALLGAAMLTACASAPQSGSMPPGPPQMAADQARQQKVANESQLEAETAPGEASGEASTQRTAPQLIKTANLTLEVTNAAAVTRAVSQIAQRQQGDVLKLDLRAQGSPASPDAASMQLRIPQARLEATISEISKLGKVLSQGLQAEDVSAQLVDLGARLRNLAKAEEATLKILDRSGSVSDVLKVSQELAKIREQIEQLKAQEASLKTRVAYSTINLDLTAAITSLPPEKNLGDEVRSAWNGSTRSVSGFSRGLLVLGIWLLAYTPYWIVLGFCIFLGRQYLGQRADRRPAPQPTAATPEP